MRATMLATLLALVPALAAAQISGEIGRTGLEATEARLAAVASPTDADRFALGGVRFLRTVEQSLQLRWRVGLTDQMQMLPFLRLPLAENPAPAPFDPAMIASLFRAVTTGMDAAREPLSAIPATSDFGVEIALADLWFDVNANATRDTGEDMLDIAGPMMLGWRWAERDPATPAPVIRFDVADAAWLSAYTHLLGGIGDVVLAHDPTAAIATTLDAKAAMLALRSTPPDIFAMDQSFGESVDIAAIVLAALNQTPDAARATSAHTHFLAMVTDNRRFWAEVALETDNAAEWLPNDAQQSALGLVVPQGAGAAWLNVLADFEGLLNGTKLAPYWRLDAGAGINVGKMFTDPRPIDLAGWIQGADALPYMQRGTVVDAASWTGFENLVGGEAMLFSVFLN